LESVSNKISGHSKLYTNLIYPFFMGVILETLHKFAFSFISELEPSMGSCECKLVKWGVTMD
jgi:hypothetical protein